MCTNPALPKPKARLSPPTLSARDAFGASVALAGRSAWVGAPGDDGLGRNTGAAFALDTGENGEGGGRYLRTTYTNTDIQIQRHTLTLTLAHIPSV